MARIRYPGAGRGPFTTADSRRADAAPDDAKPDRGRADRSRPPRPDRKPASPRHPLAHDHRADRTRGDVRRAAGRRSADLLRLQLRRSHAAGGAATHQPRQRAFQAGAQGIRWSPSMATPTPRGPMPTIRSSRNSAPRPSSSTWSIISRCRRKIWSRSVTASRSRRMRPICSPRRIGGSRSSTWRRRTGATLTGAIRTDARRPFGKAGHLFGHLWGTPPCYQVTRRQTLRHYRIPRRRDCLSADERVTCNCFSGRMNFAFPHGAARPTA